MQTALEFFKSFLIQQEECRKIYAESREVFYETFYTKDVLFSDDSWRPRGEKLLSIDVLQDAAVAVTIDSHEHPWRYHLCVLDGRWEIHSHEGICFDCAGTGGTMKMEPKYRTYRKGDGPCKICRGSGWIAHYPFITPIKKTPAG